MGDKVRPIDMPIIDQDGNTWFWFAPPCDIPPQWTMVEPIDKARWDAILEGKGTAPDPSDVRGRVERKRNG
jgi:hypothetical protein